MELSSRNAFNSIFPRYSQVLVQTTTSNNKDYESFVTIQLPAKVQLVRNIQTTFINFQNQYANLILKRPSYSNLMHSLLLKVTDRTERYFNSLALKIQKSDNLQLLKQYSHLNFPETRRDFRKRLSSIEQQLRQKYFSNYEMDKRCQQQTTKRLYNLFEIYHFTKSDLISASAKYQFDQGQVMQSINSSNPTAHQNLNGQIVKLSPEFKQYLYTIVNKRCRPFINKRDFLLNKMKQILKDSQSKIGMNLHMLMDSIVRKQKTRVNKQFYNDLMKQLKLISNQTNQNSDTIYEARQITKQVDQLKRSFAMLKNNPYFFDIQRGSFVQKYKIDMNKLQNLYYLANLEKYLQNVSQFMDNLLRIEQKVIENSKAYMKDFISKIQEIVNQLKEKYYMKYQNSTTLEDFLQQEFKGLQNSLYGIFPQESPQDDYQRQNNQSLNAKAKLKNDSQKRKAELQKERVQRQQKRRKQMQKRAQQDRVKRQQDKIRMQQKKRAQEQKYQKLKQQRQQKQRKRRQQQQSKKQRAEQQKRKRDQETRIKLQEKKKRDEQQRQKLQETRKNKEAEQKRKKEQALFIKRQQDQKRKQDEQRKILQQKQVERRKKQEQSRKRQIENLSKIQQQKQLAQKKRKEEQQKYKQQEMKRQQKLAKQQQNQQKQKDRLQKQKKQKQKALKTEQQRKQKQQKQKIQRQRKEVQERQKAEEQRRKALQKKRKQQEQRIKKQEQQRKRLEIHQQERKKQQQKRKQLQRFAVEKKNKQEQQNRKREKQAEAQKQRIKQEQKRKKQQEQQKKAQQKRKEQQKKAEQKRKEQQKKAEQKHKEQQKRAEQKRKEQQRKAEQKRKEQQKKRESQRIANEKLKQEQQKKAASIPAPKKPGKSSGIDYTDFDDIIDDDLDDIQSSQDKKKAAQKHFQKPVQNQDKQDEYENDFQDQSPDKKDQQGQQLEPKQLITAESIKCLNDYVKGTQYARKNKPNLESFNNTDQYIYIFEQMVQNNKLFIFKPQISKAMIDFGKELANQSTNEQDLRITLQTIKDQIFDAYQSVKGDRNIDPRAKMVFPFSFENPFGVKVLELMLFANAFQLILQKPLPEDEQIQSSFTNFIEGFLHVFQIQGEPQVLQHVLTEETAMVISTVDKQLPCLLILFAMHYEMRFEDKIQINQYTIERFFYSSHVLKPFYECLEAESEQEGALSTFYTELYNKYAENKKIKVSMVQIQADSSYEQNLMMNSQALKQHFLKTTEIEQSHLIMIQLIIPQQQQEGAFEKVTIYMQMSRQKGGKDLLNYYIISKDEEQQESCSDVFELISGEADDEFETNVYIDYTRHNGLSQYSEWSLPLWAHIMTKRKMTALNAFRVMTFAMTPFYVAFKEMD